MQGWLCGIRSISRVFEVFRWIFDGFASFFSPSSRGSALSTSVRFQRLLISADNSGRPFARKIDDAKKFEQPYG